jgi:predicted transcriptional regulator of viral defense system
MTDSERALELARKLGVLRPMDLQAQGIARTHLQRLVERGELHKVGRGLYVPADQEPSLHGSLAAVARHAPAAIVCLLSALRLHELTTQNPFVVWIAIATGQRAPRIQGVPLRVVRMAGQPLTTGIERHVIDGVAVPVFDIEKTVVDCFRFRNRIGLDVALEAIRDYMRRPRRKVDRLMHYAKIDRVSNTMRPYLEAIA